MAAQPKSPVVKCPGCNVPMGVKLVVTGRPGEFSKVTYACVICKAETVRQYMMPEQPPKSVDLRARNKDADHG